MLPGGLIKCRPHFHCYAPHLLEEGQRSMPVSTEMLGEEGPGAREEGHTHHCRLEPATATGWHPSWAGQLDGSARSVRVKRNLRHLQPVADEPHKRRRSACAHAAWGVWW